MNQYTVSDFKTINKKGFLLLLILPLFLVMGICFLIFKGPWPVVQRIVGIIAICEYIILTLFVLYNIITSKSFIINEDGIQYPWKKTFRFNYPDNFIHYKDIKSITTAEIWKNSPEHRIIIEDLNNRKFYVGSDVLGKKENGIWKQKYPMETLLKYWEKFGIIIKEVEGYKNIYKIERRNK